MKRRFRCIESSFFCDFFDFGGAKLLFCAVHTHVSWFLLRLGGTKGSQANLFRQKSSNLDGDAKQSRGRPQSPLVASAEAKSPCNKKDQHRETTSPDAGRSRPSGATMCKLRVEQLGGAPAGAQSYWQGRFAACALLTFPLE